MITHPKRVWLKTDNGWFSREADESDRSMNALVDKLLQPGGRLTPEERECLDVYNDSIRLEGDSLEKTLRAKHGRLYVKPATTPSVEKEKASERRSTRTNATLSEAYGTGFKSWWRRAFGV